MFLRDFKQAPFRVISQSVAFQQHTISMIDLKGLKELQNENTFDNLATIHKSTCAMLHIAAKGKHIVLNDTNMNHDIDTIIFGFIQKNVDQLTNEVGDKDNNGIELFGKNILGTCIGVLFYSSLHYLHLGNFDEQVYNEQQAYILKKFYNLLKIQFIIATIFRQNNGKLKGKVNDIMKELSIT